MEYTIYTDGAYSFARDQGGIGLALIIDNDEVNYKTYSHAFKGTTNNKMELTAVILALRAVKTPIDKLTIITDSQYVIGCATKGWKRKKNVQMWKLFDETYTKTKEKCPIIEFKWTKGHEDDKFNNICDSLAVKMTKILI